MSVETTIKDLASVNAIKSMLGIYYLIFSVPLVFIETSLSLLVYIFISVCLFVYLISARFMLNMNPFIAFINLFEELRNNPNHTEVKRILIFMVFMFMFFNCLDLLIYFTSQPTGSEILASPESTGSIPSSEGAATSTMVTIVLYAVLGILVLLYSFIYGLYSIILCCDAATLTLNSMINVNAIENGRIYRGKDVFDLVTQSHENALKYVIGVFSSIVVFSLLPAIPLVGFSILLPIVLLPALIAISAVVIEEIGLGKHQKQEETESNLSTDLCASIS